MVSSKSPTNGGHFRELAHATQRPAPTERDQTRPWNGSPSQHPSRRRRTLSVGGIVILIVLAIIGYWLAKPLVIGTIDAGRGAICPECAVDQYIYNGPHNALGDDVLFRRVLCKERRDELAEAAHAFTGAYITQLQKWDLILRLEPGKADAVHDGQRATVTATIQHLHETATGKIASRNQHIWTFELINENGWRVCRVAHPELCLDLVKCTGPASPPASSRADVNVRPGYPVDFDDSDR